MKNLKSLIKQDMLFQFRHGFYMVYGIATLIYVILLKIIGENAAAVVSPILIFSDPTFIGFFFIGAILFFEREQRVVDALFVTPVTKTQYILSKCISLTIISVLVTFFITIIVHGFFVNWFYLFLGVIPTSFLFILVGMIFSHYFKNITVYLVVGGLFLSPFSSPILPYLGVIKSNLYYIIPTTGSLKLINGAINGGLTMIDLIYSVLYLSIFTIIAFKAVLKLKGDDV